MPIAIDRYEFVPDSGGSGQFRGGLAIERHYRLLADQATLQLRSDRQKTGPYGLNGGLPGVPSRNTLVRNGRRIDLASKTTTVMLRGDRFEHQTAGAGGWGPPHRRSTSARQRDLETGKVTS